MKLFHMHATQGLLIPFISIACILLSPSMRCEAASNLIVEGNQSFGLSIFSRLLVSKQNEVISPFSIYTSLSTLAKGARGPTKTSFDSTLHLDHLDADVKQDFVTILAEVKEYAFLANGLFIDDSFPILPSYLSDVHSSFSATIGHEPFQRSPSQARDLINQWVFDETKGAIETLLLPQDVSKATRLISINTLYVEEKWKTPFDTAKSQEELFYGSGPPSVIAMMSGINPYLYAEAKGAKALLLEGTKNCSLLILLPDDFEAFTKDNSNLDIGKWLPRLTLKKALVKIPKCDFARRYELKEPLIDLGLGEAFSKTADFSGIDGSHALALNGVVHQAKLTLCEEGMTASAATAATIAIKAVRPLTPEVEFIANRPFIFYIIDQKSHLTLFLGQFFSTQGGSLSET